MLVGDTMGTTYTIKLIPASLKIDLDTLHKQIDELLVTINSVMSTYDPNSELSLLNINKSNECIEVSPSLSFIIKNAINVSEMMEGNFDITVGPLVDLWGFGPNAIPETIPNDQTISLLLNNIGYEKLQLKESNTCVKKQNADIYIDLSAIAKGFAVDEVAALLEDNLINNYMVEIGGEVKANGYNVNQIPWQIGIEKPINEQRSVQKIIPLQNYGLATSGDYRNYFEHNGKRYSHIIDANTGKPIQHNLVSVTVIHESTMIADALATAFMVKGDKEGLEIAEKNKLAVLFIIKQDNDFLEIPTTLFNNLTKH